VVVPRAGGDLPPGLMDEVKQAVATVEKEMGKKFGDKDNTLLFSVRSGAAVSHMLLSDTLACTLLPPQQIWFLNTLLPMRS